LLDKRKMKSSSERDRFEVVGCIADYAPPGIIICSGNSGSVYDPCGRVYRLYKYEVGIEIRIFRIAAVTSSKTRIHVELREIREPVHL
jgi:hypothetical protein